MVDGLAQGARARVRTADNLTAVLRLDARHENQVSGGSDGVVTPAAGKPAMNHRGSHRADRLRALGLGVALAAGLFWGAVPVQAREASPAPPNAASRQSAGNTATTPARTDRQVALTLRRIHAGGPFPYPKDGIVFGNYEHLLPAEPRGYYREYTVPTPGGRNRGARRIVCGGAPRNPDVCYYTHDHYASFQYLGR